MDAYCQRQSVASLTNTAQPRQREVPFRWRTAARGPDAQGAEHGERRRDRCCDWTDWRVRLGSVLMAKAMIHPITYHSIPFIINNTKGNSPAVAFKARDDLNAFLLRNKRRLSKRGELVLITSKSTLKQWSREASIDFLYKITRQCYWLLRGMLWNFPSFFKPIES